MLVEHLLVPNFIVHLVIQFKLDTIELHLLLIIVVGKSIDFLIDHLHDLILVKTV